jgi:hypothetical protein
LFSDVEEDQTGDKDEDPSADSYSIASDMKDNVTYGSDSEEGESDESD